MVIAAVATTATPTPIAPAQHLALQNCSVFCQLPWRTILPQSRVRHREVAPPHELQR